MLFNPMFDTTFESNYNIHMDNWEPEAGGARMTTRRIIGGPPPPDLPIEILEMIFALAATPSLDDMRKLINSNPVWKRILHSQRQLWLFPKVFPFLTKYLGRSSVLRCRLVSSHWLQGVDEFIEGAEHLAPYNKGHPWNHEMRRVPVWRQTLSNFPYWFPRRSTRSLEGDVEGQDNPFIGRGMAIKEQEQTSSSLAQPICQVVGNILPDYGFHLYYLSLKLPSGLKCSQMTDILEVIVQHAPNLRQLRLGGCRPRCANFCIPCDIGACSNPFLGTLPSRLSYLKALQLDIKFPDPHLTLENVLIQNHSERLGRLEVKTWNALAWHDLAWPHLKELHLPAQTQTTSEMEILSSLAKLVAPKLAKLCLTFPCANSAYPQEILQVLHNFPELQYLGLLFQERFVGRAMFWVKFQAVLDRNGDSFPLIKVLQVVHPPIDLQLLLHFPEIECIKITEAKGPPNCVHYQIYDVVAFEGLGYQYTGDSGMKWRGRDKALSPFESCYDRNCCRSEGVGRLIFPDFWMLLPRLQMLMAGGRLYSREGFATYAQRFQWLIIHEYPWVMDSLLQLYLPNVTRVDFHFSKGELSQDDNNLLKLLTSFPNLQRLEINCPSFLFSVLVMHTASGSRSFTFPTVKHLKTNHLPIPEDFLNCFPNLEWLEFDSGSGSRVFCKEWQDPILFGSYDPRTCLLQDWRIYRLKRVYESDVWKLLPSLKGFEVSGGGGGGWNGEYTREAHEDFVQNRFK